MCASLNFIYLDGGEEAGWGRLRFALARCSGRRRPFRPSPHALPFRLCRFRAHVSFSSGSWYILFPTSAICEVTLPANNLSRFSAFLSTRRAHRPLTKVRLRTSRRTRGSGEARSGSRRRLRRPGERTEAAPEAAAEPMPRDGGRARRDKSGARGMSPGPP